MADCAGKIGCRFFFWDVVFSASFEVPEFYATLLKSFRAAIPTEPATECHRVPLDSLDLNQLNRSQQISDINRTLWFCTDSLRFAHLAFHTIWMTILEQTVLRPVFCEVVIQLMGQVCKGHVENVRNWWGFGRLEALQVDTNFGISLRGLLLASFTAYSIHNNIDNLIIFIFCLHIFVLQHFISLHSSFSVVIMLFLAPSPGFIWGFVIRSARCCTRPLLCPGQVLSPACSLAWV